jgi:hypothetical protein
MADKGADTEEWVEFHQKNFVEAGNKVDEAIEGLAIDLNFSVSQVGKS